MCAINKFNFSLIQINHYHLRISPHNCKSHQIELLLIKLIASTKQSM
jgi:hypothetical protein